MSVIEELIRGNADTGIDFGNYELAAKTKRSDFEWKGDLYKVKTFCEITKLEKNEAFVYESVPGTAVTGMQEADGGMTFWVEGKADAEITVELEASVLYEISIDGAVSGQMMTNLGGKLTFSVELNAGAAKRVEIRRA